MKPQLIRLTLISLLALLCPIHFVNYPAAAELTFIDAHSQVDHTIDDLELIIQRMDQAGIYRTILSARSGRKPREIAAFAKKYPHRIIPAVRTKSGAYKKNNPKYYKKLRKQVDSEKFDTMAEILLYHAAKGDKAPEVVVYPYDRRVQAALNAAIENEWPFVIHIEFRALGSKKRQKFISAMEKLLAAHVDHPFALIHMGQLDAQAVGTLIEKHPNIYFLTAHTNPVIIRHSNQPWINMFKGQKLAPQWNELIKRFPQRFIFALDNVWARHWEEFYAAQIRYWRKALADLPPDIANLLARGNAERLWQLSPQR